MPRSVTCAIVSVVAWVSLKRGGSGFCGMRRLALRKRGGYDWTTFGFKKPMQFGRRVEVPPSAKQPCALPRHVEATLKFPCCSLGGAIWIDTLFRGRSHNSLAKKASCSELAPAHLKKWQKNQILTPKTASNLKPFLASNLKPFLASTIKKWKRQAQKLKPKLASKKLPFSTQGILNAGLHSLHFC